MKDPTSSPRSVRSAARKGDGRRIGSKEEAFDDFGESPAAEGGRREAGWGVRKIFQVYAVCCVLRLLNTFVIRSYFDPDEFWQTLEPSYCLAFFGEGGAPDDASYLNCPGYTWEWKRRYESAPPSSLLGIATDSLPFKWYSSYIEPSLWGPVRSHLPILPTYLLYRILRFLHLDTSYAVARGPVLLNAVLVAAPVDVAVGYAASYLYEPNVAYWCLLASLLSWFNGYSLVRTFSNSQETVLLAVAVALVAPELLAATTRKTNRCRRHRASWAFYLGGLSTAVRFTSLAAFVPMGLLLAHHSAASQQQQTAQKHVITTRFWGIRTFLTYLIWPCATFGLAGIATSVVLDRIMYGFWTVPFLGLIHFNVVLNNASLYGSHPWHWYFSAGLPAVSGLLLLPLISMMFQSNVLVGSTTRPASARNVWIILTSYVAIMSFNGHKEFRFIHPVLPLVCLLTGPALRSWAVGMEGAGESPPTSWNQLRRVLVLAVFGIANLVPVLYLGLFHQSGPVSVNRKILEMARDTAFSVSLTQPARFTVYYWTGECHSTPLHSHLHQPRNPPIKFDTWSLDCSPSCRADPDPMACETKRFQHDPVKFAKESLCLDEPDENATSSATTSECRPVPDFVVTFSSYVSDLDPVLHDRLGMTIVARYPFHLRDSALSSRKVGRHPKCWEVGDGNMCNDIGQSDTFDIAVNARNSRSRRRLVGDLFGWTLDVETDDVVLYSLVRPGVPPGASGAPGKDGADPAFSNGEL